MMIHVIDLAVALYHIYVYDQLVTQKGLAISGGTGVMFRYTGTIMISFVLALTSLSITAKGNVCIYLRF